MTTFAEVKVWLLAVFGGLVLLGLCIGSSMVVGFGIGRWWGEWELFYLMDIPQGGVVMSPRTGASWMKLDSNTLRFARIPDPRQARVVKLFPLEKKKENEHEENQPIPGPGPAPRK